MFTRETEILKRLSRAPHTHPHLITLLAIYEQLGRCNLIFPHAECNLLQYWKVQEPTPDQDGRTALWLAEQCQGLAEGLGRIHRYETVSVTGLLNPNSIPVTEIHSIESIAKDSHNSTAPQDPQRLFGRHGDIKPENILWFADHSAAGGRGILKITDFGISQFSLRTSKPASDCAPIANSPTYRPPECDLNGTISASYDIWTLGCVYLEFVTWFFGGRDYVNRFGESRLVVDPYHHSYKTDTFFSIQHDHSGTRKAKVKDKVNDVSKHFLRVILDLVHADDRAKWIKRLHLKAADIPFFQDFLKMISSSLLIIDGRSTTDSAEGRKSSASIARELSGMVQKCKKVVYYIPPHLGPSTTDASVGSFHSPASSRASSIVQEEIIMNNPIEEMGT
jgi:serine/threonine protein kinase